MEHWFFYLRKRCWNPGRRWKSLRWSEVEPWSCRRAQRWLAGVVANRWAGRGAAQNCRSPSGAGSHGDPPGETHETWTAHLRRGGIRCGHQLFTSTSCKKKKNDLESKKKKVLSGKIMAVSSNKWRIKISISSNALN